MEIIDIHAHIFQKVAGITKGAPMTSLKDGKVKIGNNISQFMPPSFENTNSRVETLIAYMDWCGISKALLMPNPYYGYHNDYFLEAIERYPDRLRGVALVDLLKGEQAARELETLYEKTPLFGFKVETDSTFQCAPDKHLADPEFNHVWDLCSQCRQPVFLHLFTDRDVEDLEILVREFPGSTYVICHMGADSCFAPGRNPRNYERLLKLVKERENVYMDTSTVPVYFSEEYPFPSSTSAIKKAAKTVGPEKLMWASDYPGMLNHATMKELICMVTKHCAFSDDDLEMIMGGTARRLFFQ